MRTFALASRLFELMQNLCSGNRAFLPQQWRASVREALRVFQVRQQQTRNDCSAGGKTSTGCRAATVN